MFSLIIPLYNKSDYIAKAVESVLTQSYKNFELIIVNDGSTDNSLEVIESICKSVNSKISLINQKNSGVSSARNNGVKAAKYDYIALLDADDWWDKDFLLEMFNLINDFPDGGLYGCNYYSVKNSKNRVLNVGVEEGFEKGYIDYFKTYSNTFCVPINCSFVVVKKNVFDEVGGFNRNLKFSEDLDLWIRIALKYKVAYLNKHLAYSNQNIPVNLRALGEKIWKKEEHAVFNFEYLKNEESQNTDFKYLLDGIRVRSLMRYYLGGVYRNEVKEILSEVDMSKQPKYFQRVYFYPKWLIRFYFQYKKVGSLFKQRIIKSVHRLH